jgi:hypothetical protein
MAGKTVRARTFVILVGTVAFVGQAAGEPATIGAGKAAIFGRAYQRAARMVQTCEAPLERSFAVDVGLDTFTKLAWSEAGQRVHLCRDSNNVALAAPGKPAVLLCAPQFWQVAEQDPDQAAAFLVHEYLHTRGLREWPQEGARYDSVGITKAIKARCKPKAR